MLLPRLRVCFAFQDHKVAMQCIAENLGTIDPEGVCPLLDRGRVFVGHTKAEHRHTLKSTAYDNGCRRKQIVRATPRSAASDTVTSMASRQTPDSAAWARLVDTDPRRSALVAVALRMRLEAAAVELVDALRGDGIVPLVLKGPSVAGWLYGPLGERREYQDLDLLVSPAEHERAGNVLERLGYARDFDDRGMPPWWREHAVVWVRSDGTTVDLHRWLPGIGADPAAAWEILARGAESVEIRSRSVPALGLPARALHLALHAAQHGPAQPGVLRDLEYGLDAGGEELWRAAAALAVELDAEDGFAAGLRLTPAGDRLAARFELRPVRSVRATLLAASPPPVALGLVQLAEARGVRSRLTIVARKLFPPPEFIRHWDPSAARGRTALVRAYIRRPLWLLQALPAGLSAWVAARRRARQ